MRHEKSVLNRSYLRWIKSQGQRQNVLDIGTGSLWRVMLAQKTTILIVNFMYRYLTKKQIKKHKSTALVSPCLIKLHLLPLELQDLQKPTSLAQQFIKL